MMEAITEVIRDNSHPFRKMEHQPKKPLKNRYERRKIKEYLQTKVSHLCACIYKYTICNI